MRQSDRLFLDTRNEENLNQKSIRGGAITMAGGLISLFLRIGSIIVLARILMPEDFGLIGMVTALTAIAERFKDLGLSSATVQRKKISKDEITTLFWINAGLGILIMFGLWGLAKTIGWFYEEDRLVPVTFVISTSFLFGGLTIQHQALLRRNMFFGSISFISVISDLLSIGVAIILALNGFSYWAIVSKEVTRSFFIALGTWMRCGWLPGLPNRINSKEILEMLRFGRNVTAFNFIHFISRSLDQILIGKYYGATALGFYRQAQQLIFLPLSQLQFPVDYVAESTLSALQDDGIRYKSYYENIILLLSFFLMPIVVYLFVYAEPIILILLGEKWISSALIAQILLIGSFIQPMISTCGFVMVTCGKTGRYFWWGLLNSIILICAFSIGIKWGVVGIAAAISIAVYITFIPSLIFCFRGTPVSIKGFLNTLVLPTIGSLIMGYFIFRYYSFVGKDFRLIHIIISVGIGVFTYLALFTIIPKGRNKLNIILKFLVLLFKKNR